MFYWKHFPFVQHYRPTAFSNSRIVMILKIINTKVYFAAARQPRLNPFRSFDFSCWEAVATDFKYPNLTRYLIRVLVINHAYFEYDRCPISNNRNEWDSPQWSLWLTDFLVIYTWLLGIRTYNLPSVATRGRLRELIWTRILTIVLSVLPRGYGVPHPPPPPPSFQLLPSSNDLTL